MARVSIITPAWKAAEFLPETIGSVQAQTFGDWEMLIADDCSPDNTRDVISRFAANDPRIKLVALDQNGGPAKARQAALDQATGRYIAFLDSDDLWLPPKLERQLAHMDITRAALSYTAFRRINEVGSVTGRLITVPTRLSYRQLLKNTAIATLTAVIDRDIAGHFAIPDVGYDDFGLWLSILRRGHIAHGLGEDLARYRVVGGSVSSKPARSAKWVWTIYRESEGLGPVHAAWCLGHYGARAYLKRVRF